MRDWRNGQTRTFKGRVGDRVSSSLTSRTTRNGLPFLFYVCLSANLAIWLGGILASLVAVAIYDCSAEGQMRTIGTRNL